MLKIRRTARSTSEITIASMSDIAFLLIIFFLVTSVFIIKEGIHLVLPDKSIEPVVVTSSDVITIRITSKALYLDDRRIEKNDLGARINDESKKNPGLYISLKISGEVTYDSAMEVLDIIKQSGVVKVAVNLL